MKTLHTAGIELPVTLRNPGGEFWRIEDTDGKRIADFNSEAVARQIKTALNCHDHLLEACRAAQHALSLSANPFWGDIKKQIAKALTKATAD